jgi:hypothetical protein
LILGEVDLDRVLFGTKVISTRFLVSGKVAIQWRLLAALVVVGVPGGNRSFRAREVSRLLA